MIRIPSFPYKRSVVDETFDNWTGGHPDDWYDASFDGYPLCYVEEVAEGIHIKNLAADGPGTQLYLMARGSSNPLNVLATAGHVYRYRISIDPASVLVDQVGMLVTGGNNTGGTGGTGDLIGTGIHTGTLTAHPDAIYNDAYVTLWVRGDVIINSIEVWDLTLDYTPTHDVLGNPITNPAGTVSNDAGCKFVQTSAAVLARGAGFWVNESHEGIRVDHAGWLARRNGELDQADKWEKLGAMNTCCVVESLLFEEGTSVNFTEADRAAGAIWSNDSLGCGAGWRDDFIALTFGDGEFVQLSTGEKIYYG